jgi:flagellar biosynthesis protein FlhF
MKMFYAESMPEAIRLVREELGDSAIILSSQKGENGKGIRVTAAVDEELEAPPPPLPKIAQPQDAIETIADALDHHGTPPALAERLIRAAAPLAEKLLRAASALSVDAPIMTMAAALDSSFNFAPLPEKAAPRPLLMIGPPGGGKTVTVAKLAARAVLANRRVNVITTDTMRAGGVDQLAAFTRILDLDLQTALDAETLADALTACRIADPDALTIIDTGSANPHNQDDLTDLERLIRAVDVDSVLVMPAGYDAQEAADCARAFATAGAARVLVTRTDAARRLGSVLVAADTGKLKFCDMSNTPHVADGLHPLNPVSLARLLLPGSKSPGIAPNSPPLLGRSFLESIPQ